MSLIQVKEAKQILLEIRFVQIDRTNNLDFGVDFQYIVTTQGRLSEALGWAREKGLSVEDELSYLREFEHITLARVLIADINTEAAQANVERISEAFGYRIDLLITHRALMLTLGDGREDRFFSRLKRTSPHSVNFRIVSGISRMSWRVVEEKFTPVYLYSDHYEHAKRLRRPGAVDACVACSRGRAARRTAPGRGSPRRR